jgi:hypothetical protein
MVHDSHKKNYSLFGLLAFIGEVVVMSSDN